jgi:hypothetical protein
VQPEGTEAARHEAPATPAAAESGGGGGGSGDDDITGSDEGTADEHGKELSDYVDSEDKFGPNSPELQPREGEDTGSEGRMSSEVAEGARGTPRTQ